MDSRQARELLETLRGAGSVRTWSLHPRADDLNDLAHQAELVGEQVTAFIFQRAIDTMEGGGRPDTISIIVDVEATGTPFFKCPKCKRKSYNPNDIEQGYCGACHAFTDPRDATRAGGSQPTGSA